MRVLPISDFHPEAHCDHGTSFIQSLPTHGVDALIIAGDAGSLLNGSWLNSLKLASDRFPHVLFVLGNHEFWRMDALKVHDLVASVKLPSNVHWLNNSSVVLNGQRFLGATLWFKSFGDNHRYYSVMGDFQYINNFTPWVYDQNEATRDYLSREVTDSDVVVTHHIPCWELVQPQWRGESTNRFFVGSVPAPVVQTPKLWVFGHTHDSTDRTFGNARVIANPFGEPYCGLNRKFDDRKVVDLS